MGNKMKGQGTEYRAVNLPISLHLRLKRISEEYKRTLIAQVTEFVEQEEKRLDTP